jgi:hypothetical protein
MGRFDISPEVEEEYRRKFREAVQAKVDGEVLAAGHFRTTGSGTKYGISKLQIGALAYGAAAMRGKQKAGGLSGSFLLAVTPDAVHAFKYKQKRDGVEVKEEVASWSRDGMKVSAKPMKTTTRVTLETGDGEEVVCDQEGMGHNPWADDVVRELGG